MTAAQVVESDMQRWLERAVIGLNLCPFAKAVHAKAQVRYAVSAATGAAGALADLRHELAHLVATPAAELDTTLLVLPDGFHDFYDFNDLLSQAERAVRRAGFEGEVQLASFHPLYQFADAELDDIANCTNRAPYPALHLLREASVERAVVTFPDTDAIYRDNIATLQRLGTAGWAALGVGASAPAGASAAAKGSA